MNLSRPSILPAEDVKRIFKDIKKESPLIKSIDRRYKVAYSETVWALVDQVVEENERLDRHINQVEDMLKIVRNQQEMVVHELRGMKKAVEHKVNSLCPAES